MIYLTEGNIPLNAAYDDDIVQEANSTYQLTFKFPTNDILWQRLREEKFLTADDLHGEQDFVIFEVEKKHGYIQVYANQAMTLLNHYVVNPISLDRETGSTALSRFAGSITRSNPFSFFSDIEDRHTFNIDSKTAMEALTKDKHSIVGLWGGDLVRHGYQVRLLKNGGSENESLFMYKKNLSSYEHKTSTKSLRTRITFITTIRGEGENPVDKHYKIVVDSPLINKYSQIYEDVVEVNDQDVKDEASLREYGKQYFRKTLCDMLEDSIEIDVIGQSDVPVQMFDVVGVFHEYYDLDVRKKITKYNYSPMAKKLKSIGFGEFKSGLASAIGNVVSDAVKNETQHLDGIFEAKLEKEIKNADLAFDRKVKDIKDELIDGIEQAKAKAEENKRALSDEIDRRFHEFGPVGFEEAKNKAEEALKKAGTSAELISEIKEVIRGNSIDLINISSRVNEQDGKITDFKNEYGSKMLEVTQTTDGIKTKIGEITSFIDKDGQRQEELKRYAREETSSKTNAIRETISRDYVAKSTFTETVESTNQRFETLKRDTEVKLADYKQGIDGRFTSLASQIAGKVNDADFQRVKETSQLYERVLGNTEQGLPDKISRLVMTNEIFQTEVNDLVVSDNNLIVNSEKLDKHTIVNKRNGVNIYNTPYGVFNIDAQSLTGYNWGGFTLPIYVPKILKGEVYTLGFKYKIRRQLDHEFCVVIKNHSQNKTVLQKTIANPETPVRNVWIDFQSTFKMTEDLDFDQVGSFPIYFYLVKNGWIEVKEPMLVRGPKTGSFKPSQFDEAYKMTDEAKGLATDAQTRAIQLAQGLEATRTQVTQIAGSWAVQNLTNAGSIVSQINATNNQILIEAEKIRLKGKTLLDELTAIDGYFKRLFVGDARIGKLNTDIIESNSITADKVLMDQAMARKFVSNDIFTDTLAAKTAFINKLRSVVVTATLLEGFKGRIGGFQIGTHDKDPSVYWLTGINQFAVGMSNGSSAWGQTALWVNWGDNWNEPKEYAWFVKRTGEMFCYNKAQFWNTPRVHGNLEVTGNIFYYIDREKNKVGYYLHSETFTRIQENAGYAYLYRQSGGYAWVSLNKDVSDRRYKTNIQDSKVSGLDIIEKLKTYSYRKEYDDKIEDISCGIMAQDVQKYAPEAFFENPDGAYSYNTFALVPYLIKAIQELNQKVERLEIT